MKGRAPFDYEGALTYIAATGRFGIKLGLDRTRALLDAAGAPDRGMIGALVGGTNGKGSTCAVLGSILDQAGLSVAAMPKPHLVSYTERVVIDGVPISEADFATAVTDIVPAVDAVTPAHGPPTEFEILTAVALRFARQRGADVLVCEVGMGGRLDATNVTDLGVKVITSIALDHQQYLGDTIAKIAAEKAGIIQGSDLVVAGSLPPAALAVVRERCREQDAELVCCGEDFDARSMRCTWEGTTLDFVADGAGWLQPLAGLHTPLLGAHQAANVAVAAAAAQALRRRHGLMVEEAAIRSGIASARWPGRLELFPGPPAVLLDGGHNPAAVAAVVAAVRDLGTEGAPVLLFGAMADKDLEGMLGALPADWPAVFTRVEDERAIPEGRLLELANATGRRDDAGEATPEAALERARARAGQGGLVLVLGSLYLAGAVRPLLAAE
ncbi:MAG: folylpolyglutamate synthase/dihydrofolate synthase family protein [Candidatus Dormibacteria bacterium]